MVNSSSKSFLFYTSLTKKSLHNYKNYISSVLKKFNIEFKIVSLPLKKKKKTLLKSPHVTKKAKESFELTFFKFVVQKTSKNKKSCGWISLQPNPKSWSICFFIKNL